MQCAKHALCHARLARNFQGLIDCDGKVKEIGEYMLAENNRMFSLWHMFLKNELNQEALQREMETVRNGMKQQLRQCLEE